MKHVSTSATTTRIIPISWERTAGTMPFERYSQVIPPPCSGQLPPRSRSRPPLWTTLIESEAPRSSTAAHPQHPELDRKQTETYPTSQSHPTLSERLLLAGSRPISPGTILTDSTIAPSNVGDWRLLPAQNWSNEFSPLYENSHGALCEGIPADDFDDEPEVFRYTEEDESTGTCIEFEAVQNEAVIRFDPRFPAIEIRKLLSRLALKVCFAAYDQSRDVTARRFSWFHVEVQSGSPFHCNVLGLTEYLNNVPGILNASPNDTATLCTPLYAPRSEPTDPVFLKYRDPTFIRARLASSDITNPTDAAWYSDDADMATATDRKPVCVVIMDTGIDVDHPDFGLRSRNDPVPDGQIYSINGARVAIRVTKSNALFGPIGIWRHTLEQPSPACTIRSTATSQWKAASPDCSAQPFQDLLRAPSSPELRVLRDPKFPLDPLPHPQDVDPDPCDPDDGIPTPLPTRIGRRNCKDARPRIAPDPWKFIDLRYLGHGHGTVMAGIVAAKHDSYGSVGFGTSHVKVMSATMRMIKDNTVDLASAVKCVSKLTSEVPVSDDNRVRVVLMAFAQANAVRRNVEYNNPKSKRFRRKKVMDDLLAAIKFDSFNDRLWVAPAGEDGVGDTTRPVVLSYPAALNVADIDDRNELSEDAPAILGVTGPRFQNPIVAPLRGNTFSPGGRPDLRAYGVSAFVDPLHTIDVRESWYGARWGYDMQRRNPTWRSTHGAKSLRGYANEVGEVGTGPIQQSAGYSGRTNVDVDNVTKKPVDYVGTGEYAVTGVSMGAGVPVPTPLNSIAAAQVAALAGVLFSREASPLPTPALTAKDVRDTIIRTVRVDLSGVICVSKSGAPCDASTPVEQVDFRFVQGETTPEGTNSGRVPPPIDFLEALTS
jgi:subtilisin family serine protease